MQGASFEIDLVPTKGDELGHAKTVPVSDENERSVAVPVSADRRGRSLQLLHLVWR